MATILVADDRPAERQLLTTLLGYYKHHVLEASNGEQALTLARQHRPDLIITDVLMPVMDGYEFVRRLRQFEDVAQIPVIFYTATYQEREVRNLATQCGVADILLKPSEPEVILAKVEASLQRDTGASAERREEPFEREHARVVNAKLLDKIEDLATSERRLAAVVDICRDFAVEHNPLELLRRVGEVAQEITLAGHSVVGLVNADGTTVEVMLRSGAGGPKRPSAGSPRLAAVLRPVIAERAVVRKRNPRGDPELLGLPPDRLPVFSYLAVPISSPSRVYGWLSVRNKLGADEFTDADERVVLILASHAGIGLDNARLLDDLRQQATRLQSIDERTTFALAAARMGVWELEAASGRLTWSDTMASVFGLVPDAAPATGDAFFELVHPDDRSLVAEFTEHAMRGEPDREVEFRAIWPDGTQHWVAGRARLMPESAGRPARVLGVGIDISARKTLEAQFRQAQKMEAIGQLAGGVAHDFNNLLTAILGYSAFVVETFPPDDPRRADMLEVVKAGERAAALTKQLLAFSRKQILQPTTVNLNALVTGVRQMLSRLIGENIELVTTLAPDLGFVRADAGQLEQVVVNLVVNARDAMPNGGHLSIETANVDLDDSYAMKRGPVRPGPYVMLTVSDTGVGMTDEVKRRLFEPFFTTKERGRGTGLGLATVYGIVKQSDGYIWVYSEPNAGTSFKVYLPRVDGEIATESATHEDRAAGGTETVLVVEDEDAVRKLVRGVLERQGYRVLEASRPEEASALFDQHGGSVDLLVTDIVMPGSSGPTLYRRLVERQPGLKVLYTSGYTDDMIAHQGQLDPGIDFLQKPFSADVLSRRVRDILDR